MHQFDVVILGAGPAGAITALKLKKSYPRLTVALIEAYDYQSVRPGEILADEALPILQQLDMLDSFMGNKNAPILRKTGEAKKSEIAPNTFSGLKTGLNTNNGWHLDRSRFDGLLAGYAAASGASFIRAAMTGVRLKADGKWEIEAHSATAQYSVTASFVVDATGRNARFASEIGVAQLTYDSMIGIVRIINPEDIDTQAELEALIEPFEHGWWYSTLTSNKQLAIVAMTDADLGKRLKLTYAKEWLEHLSASPRTYERLSNIKVEGDLSVRAANTRSLYSYYGNNWLAVGDAATSLDSLSREGILHALRFGNLAGDAIAGHFQGNQSSLKDYAALVQTEFDESLNLRAEIYRSETRWKDAQFWTRRQTLPTPPDMRQGRKSTLSISNGATIGGNSQSKRAVAIRTQ